MLDWSIDAIVDAPDWSLRFMHSFAGQTRGAVPGCVITQLTDSDRATIRTRRATLIVRLRVKCVSIFPHDYELLVTDYINHHLYAN
jgi:hypothetical protein